MLGLTSCISDSKQHFLTDALDLVLANMLPHPAVLKSRYQKKRLVSFHFSFCEIICWWHLHWYLSSGEDVRGGGGNLHGVLGAVPHLLHPLLPLSSDRPQGVDLQCLPGGAVILITSQSTTYFRPIFIGKNNLDLFCLWQCFHLFYNLDAVLLVGNGQLLCQPDHLLLDECQVIEQLNHVGFDSSSYKYFPQVSQLLWQSLIWPSPPHTLGSEEALHLRGRCDIGDIGGDKPDGVILQQDRNTFCWEQVKHWCISIKCFAIW